MRTPGLRRRVHVVPGIGLLASATVGALAQEAMFTQAATMPGPGSLIWRPLVHYTSFGTHPVTGVQETRELEIMNTVQIGLIRDLSLTIDVPVKFMDERLPSGERREDVGVPDLDFMFKHRFFRSDGAGVDTTRAAILFGAEVTSGDSPRFASQGVNPHFGVVLTTIRGRHGFNQDLLMKINTAGQNDTNRGGDGTDDAIFANSAYVFRLAPARFTAESDGAWYATLELSNIYETNGDFEMRWSPGVMYEGRRWAFEAMLQLPVVHDLDERAELDWSVGAGLRFTF